MMALVGFVFNATQSNNKKVSRVYERIDRIRADTDAKVIALFGTVDKKYVSKEMCDVLHKQTADDVAEIKADVKKLLTKNGVK